MAFDRKDRFFLKAKEDGFLARSAYKLKEIQKKFKVLRQGDFVIDLGASPGSWSQVAVQLIGPKGFLVGIDLKPVEHKAPNAKFYQMNIFELDTSIFESKIPDVIISDMAPNTTGVKSVDQARSEELCLEVVKVADQHLKTGGHLIMKLFEGAGAEEVVAELKKRYQNIKRFKPEAVRKGSFETYLIALNKR